MNEGHDADHGSEPVGFFRTYLWSTNHKTIGKQFLITSFFFLLVAGALALSLRWQLAYPGRPVPVIGKWFFANKSEKARLPKAQDALAEAKGAVENAKTPEEKTETEL